MLCICGKSGSGKTTIVNELTKRGWTKVIQYTTRPPRKGEVNGIDYNFISTNDFLRKIEEGFFVEWQMYDTIFGKWYYGSTKEDYLGDRRIAILSPRSLLEVKKNMPSLEIYSVYIINGNNDRRLCERGDNINEINRRKEEEKSDFKYIYDIVDSSIKNDGILDISLIADMIVYSYYGWKI